jgi:hypothetical protein
MQMMPGQVIQAPAAGQPTPYTQPQPTPAPAQGSGSPTTYENEPANNGNNNGNQSNYSHGAPPPAAPNGNGTQNQQHEPSTPIPPIPREESHEPPADPTSGPAIIPPAYRTTRATEGRTWAYSRLTYQPGESSQYPVESARVTPHVDPRPAVDDGGWRPSSR